MWLFSKIVYFLLTIDSNIERRRHRVDYGNRGMIIFYFIQMLGYLYSEFESKSLTYYENIYLAKIEEQSSVTQIMATTIYYDPATLCMYYGIFFTMFMIFGLILIQIFWKPLPNRNPINRFIRFYFQNFQWYFLIPFHECMIGVMTCGRLSYLSMNSTLNPEECFQQISTQFIIISVCGSLLVIMSAFLSLYCFRNYEFLQGDVMHKFSYFNLMSILMFMILQFNTYWQDAYRNAIFIRHMLFVTVLILITLNTYINVPFGYSRETVFFAKVLGCSILQEILVMVWIFSNSDDTHIFIPLLIIAPLVCGLVGSYFDVLFDSECAKFCLRLECSNIEYTLEYLCLLCHQEQVMEQKDCFLFLKYIRIHCDMCNDIYCPCKQRIGNFTSGPFSLNIELIYVWIQYQFQQAIKQIGLRIFAFESLAIKFVTYLQKYRENQLLSQKMIQEVVSAFDNIGSHPYFLINLTKRIRLQNKTELEKKIKSGIQICHNEFRLLQDFNIYQIMEAELIDGLQQLLHSQKLLWTAKLNECANSKNLFSYSSQIEDKIQSLRKSFNVFQMLRETPRTDSLLILRIRLLIALVCKDDLNIAMTLTYKIQNEELENNVEKQFDCLKFFNGQALSIVSKIGQNTLGQISQKVNDQFYNFFGYLNNNTQFTQISQLLPSQIGVIHNGLIENFIQLGKSSRLFLNSEQFICNSENLIEKVNLCLTTIFSNSNESYTLYLVGHLQKFTKYNNELLDLQKKGYMLVDSQFSIFGITKNIFERINYSFYYKKQGGIISVDQIYNQVNLKQLIPQSVAFLEQQISQQTQENYTLGICSKEGGLLNADFKHFNQTQKQFPIQFSIIKKSLRYLVNQSPQEYIYYIIEVDFLDKLEISNQIITQKSALSNMLNLQYDQMHSSRIMMSQDMNEKIDLIDQSNQGSKRTPSDYNKQIEQVASYIDRLSMPQPFVYFIAQFLFQSVMFILIIVLISLLFKHKKDIQSDCIQQITYDLDFLDAYSEIMAGSRHVIYYRDFYQNMPDTIIETNQMSFTISKYDKVYIAWQYIHSGNEKLLSQYEKYSKQVENSHVELINLNFINYDLKSKITQPIQSYSQYYQIMYQIFYMAYQNFASNPNIYLKGDIDTYFTQLSRSTIYYNFFDLTTNANLTLNDCKIYNQEANNYFDSVISYYFVGIYFILVFELITLVFYNRRLLQLIQLYLKLFQLCDRQDCIYSIQQCDTLLSIVKFDKILLRLYDFEYVMSYPQQIIDSIKATSIMDSHINKSKTKIQSFSNISQTYSVLTIIMIFFCQVLYALSFQIYFQNLKSEISPINNRALQAQQMRLNFIVSVNRLDLYFIKVYYQNQSISTQNIKTNSLILNLLDINQSTLQNDLYNLQSIDFANLILDDKISLNSQQQQQILGGDVCIITGCNMQQDILQYLLYEEYLSNLFYDGIVSLHQIVFKILNQYNESNLENYFNDQVYVEYIFWGMSAIQYQISQFSQYFINLSLQTLVNLTQYNQITIIIIGIILLVIIIICQILLVRHHLLKYKQAKEILKFIPLPVLFQKKIPNHLASIKRNYNL